MFAGAGFILIAFWDLLYVADREDRIETKEIWILIGLFALSAAAMRPLGQSLVALAAFVILMNVWLLYRLVRLGRPLGRR